ncbi:MAG: transcriptional regulator [Gemmataceae bacterium]|nr:transcriptional regulator [Gemmataceae bacterium]
MPLGRPRSFDIDEALDRAMEVFWRLGYEGTSIPELTKAMGINRPSLYAAFGNKESLFRKALDRYAAGPAGYVREALDRPTARAVAEQLLAGAIELMTTPGNPKGCLVVQGALACGEAADSIRQELVSRRAAIVDNLQSRFERAKRDGDLSADVDCADLARYVATVIHGLTVQAAGSASREQLQRVADMAMRAWPA